MAVNAYAPLLVVQQLLKQVSCVGKLLPHLHGVLRSNMAALAIGACRSAPAHVDVARPRVFKDCSCQGWVALAPCRWVAQDLKVTGL
jgi:hypothetical protein